MSCRTTAAGSLATTFVQHFTGIEDGQATNLFHQLRREAAAHPHVTEADFRGTVTGIHNYLRSSSTDTDSTWTPALLRRAFQRIARTTAEATPAADIRYAVVNMTSRAADLARVLNRRVTSTAAASGIPYELALDEFHRLYTEYRRLTPDQRRTLDPLPTDTFTDPATVHALAVLASGTRCTTCGQYLAHSGSHTCPPENRRPLAGTFSAAADSLAIDAALNRDLRDLVTGHAPEPSPQTATTEEDATDAGDMDRPDWTGTVTAWDITEFQERYDAARTRIAAGDTRVPALGTNLAAGSVTAGLGTRGTGNSFGIELELDFPDDPWPFRAREQFAARLHAEGITASPHVERWHYVGDDRPGGTFQETPNGWICEFDRSVDDEDGERGVEIKSQILYDEPRTWENIDRICAIARELGGRPTMRTGLHVNVGGSGFPNDDPVAHNALLRLAAAYDDTLVRLAHNPDSGPVHRGRGYCGMTYVPPSGFDHIAAARNRANHYSAFNLGHLPAHGQEHQGSSRVEVRLWDSTVDPGRIQAAVAISLAMVKLAQDGRTPGQDSEPAGSHRQAFGRNRLTGVQWEESTAAFRRFVTLMGEAGLNRPGDLDAFTHMFAESRWQAN